MLCSMTGYGKGESKGPFCRYFVEIKSVNNRYCDISVRTPRELSLIDEFVKRYVKDNISRGKIDVVIRYESDVDDDIQSLDIKVSINAMQQYIKAFENAGQELGIKNDITLNSLVELPEVVSVEKKQFDIESMFGELKPALEEAVKKLVAFRQAEGENLCDDMLEKIGNIDSCLEKIMQRAPMLPLEYSKLLEERLLEYYDLEKIDEARLAQEIALIAEKCCIDEEIVRLKGHLEHFSNELNGDGRVGRKLEFITQEINREVNTIGSKSNDHELSKMVIEMKSMVEQIREQVQNIE